MPSNELPRLGHTETSRLTSSRFLSRAKAPVAVAYHSSSRCEEAGMSSPKRLQTLYRRFSLCCIAGFSGVKKALVCQIYPSRYPLSNKSLRNDCRPEIERLALKKLKRHETPETGLIWIPYRLRRERGHALVPGMPCIPTRHPAARPNSRPGEWRFECGIGITCPNRQDRRFAPQD